MSSNTSKIKASFFSDPLVQFILPRLEVSPNAVFREAELREISDESFQLLEQEGFLAFKGYCSGTYFSDRLGDQGVQRVLRINGDNIRAIAVGGEAPTLDLRKEEITEYCFSIERLAREISEANKLDGEFKKISPRFVRVGVDRVSQTGVFLGFFEHEQQAKAELKAGPYSKQVVLCPTRELFLDSVEFLQFNDWTIPKRCFKVSRRDTDEDRLEFLEEEGYIRINEGDGIKISRAQFVLLLALTIRRKEGSGWLDKTEAHKIGIIAAPGENVNHFSYLVSELNKTFRGYWGRDLVESKRGFGAYRLVFERKQIKGPIKWLRPQFDTLIPAVIKERESREVQKQHREETRGRKRVKMI